MSDRLRLDKDKGIVGLHDGLESIETFDDDDTKIQALKEELISEKNRTFNARQREQLEIAKNHELQKEIVRLEQAIVAMAKRM